MKEIISKDCPFCNPDRRRAQFAEAGNFLAIYNIAPILPGHSLIIPRWHVQSLMELDDDEICEMVLFSRNVVRLLQKVFGATGFNWTIQEGEEAGQTVPHLHLHLIPRMPGDLPRPGDWYPKLVESEEKIIDSEARPRLTPEQMDRIVSKIKEVASEENFQLVAAHLRASDGRPGLISNDDTRS